MHCSDVKQAIDNGLPGPMAAPELAAHLQGCEQCMEYAENVRLQRLLRSLTVPAPAPHFEQRVMAPALARLDATRNRSAVGGWALATAAAVVLAITVLWGDIRVSTSLNESGYDNTVAVYVQPNQLRNVDVVLDSKHFVENALLTVRLDSNLVLEGAIPTQTLQWRSNLKAGGNRLSLPVRLLGPGEGELEITVEHAGKKRQLKMLVKEGSVEESQKSVI